jgi:hypothetical protein
MRVIYRTETKCTPHTWISGTDVGTSLNITCHTEAGVLKWPKSMMKNI